MRNTLKATTLESKLPLLAVEHGCIISKDADITVAFEVSLPELFTVTSQEYEAMHGAWCKAIKVLPHYSVVHKQDWFVSERYKPELQKDDLSFLDRSFERHFNERPYLSHRCYLFLTKTTKERARQQSNFSTLCRGRLTPKELNHEMIIKFMESVEQFERIINDTGEIFCKLKAMERHASPPSSLIWHWLLVSFDEPLVSFVTALFEGRGDYRKEFSVLGAVVVHHSRYPATSVGRVEGLILLLSGLGGRYSVLGHSCHSLGGVVTTAGVGGGRVKLMLSCARQSSSCWR